MLLEPFQTLSVNLVKVSQSCITAHSPFPFIQPLFTYRLTVFLLFDAIDAAVAAYAFDTAVVANGDIAVVIVVVATADNDGDMMFMLLLYWLVMLLMIHCCC